MATMTRREDENVDAKSKVRTYKCDFRILLYTCQYDYVVCCIRTHIGSMFNELH
jgi:hypothetical protein